MSTSIAEDTSLEQIRVCEERLIKAFKANDLAVFDELLHDNLLFNLPGGQTVTKAIDLESHRLGLFAVSSILASEQLISLIDNHAVVCVTIDMKGKYLDQLIDGKFRYQRIWKSVGTNNWKVIAGSCIQIPG